MGNEKNYEEIGVQKSDQVSEHLETRHILDEELKMVIHHAETEGEKLYQPESNRFLAKMRIANATFYVKYSVTGENNYAVHSAYFHRAEILED